MQHFRKKEERMQASACIAIWFLAIIIFLIDPR